MKLIIICRESLLYLKSMIYHFHREVHDLIMDQFLLTRLALNCSFSLSLCVLQCVAVNAGLPDLPALGSARLGRRLAIHQNHLT